MEKIKMFLCSESGELFVIFLFTVSIILSIVSKLI